MDWNKHRELEGRHATLSPSGYHWLGYSAEKMRTVYLNQLKKEQGTFLHDLAHRMIISRTKARELKKAFNMFVNDCIGYGMSSEVVLKYSNNCFGTADGIKYDDENETLYVFDLKTGLSKPSFKQLYIYCALFCLEYLLDTEKVVPDMTFVCRLYQGNGYEEEIVDPSVILETIKQIVAMDQVLSETYMEVGNGLFN